METQPRVVVIGDIGGHRKPFFGMLRRLGITTSTNTIPADITIVQVGDLIGPSPEASGKILRTVRDLRRHNPGRWIQLMGNWEAKYHPHGHPFTAVRQGNLPDLYDSNIELLNQIWEEPYSGTAAVIESDEMAPALITHAGVTKELLQSICLLYTSDAADE